MSRPPTLNPLKTVGHATPRIDAVERGHSHWLWWGCVVLLIEATFQKL